MLAAACWAAYILLNRAAGARLSGLQAPAAATLVSALLYLPVAAVLLVQGGWDGIGVRYAVAAGVLSSVVPYAADLIALRRLQARFFGVFMSIHPVLAGLFVLGEVLDPHQWAGIVIVLSANAVATVSTSRPLTASGCRAATHRCRGGRPCSEMFGNSRRRRR